MIEEFVNRFMERKSGLESMFTKNPPNSYANIVEAVIRVIQGEDCLNPDPDTIHEIDDGDYQGTLLYVIPAKTYQPSTYWYVFVLYGSCSGCDTLKSIKNDDTPDEAIRDYMLLALQIVEGLKRME